MSSCECRKFFAINGDLYLRIEGRYLVASSGSDEELLVVIKINCCPICGRKIIEE
jgi:hypothetical protein